MSLNQQTIIYDVEQFKVYSFASSDVVNGPSPTYNAGVICEGVADVSFTPNVVSNDLKGDGGRIIARIGRIDMWQLSVTYGRLGLDALNIMCGGQITDTGSGTAEQIQWLLSMPNTLPFFKAAFLVKDTDNGVQSVIGSLYKCQLKSATFTDSKTDAFAQPKLEVEAIPLLSTGQIGDITLFASVQSLPA